MSGSWPAGGFWSRRPAGRGGEMLRAFREYWDRRRRSSDLRARFTFVHDKNLWGSGESRSGFGSGRGAPSVGISEDAIAKAIAEHPISSMNDIPCGDFNWMPALLARLPPLRYCGFDIVKPILMRNKEKFPEREFRLLDITTHVPTAADLIFCKDLLNHLRDEDVKRAVENMRLSGSTFLLVSNNCGFSNGPLPDEPSGSRHLDITAPPFNYRPPLWTLGGYMSFWRLADMGECGF
jgi:hypothetical protein